MNGRLEVLLSKSLDSLWDFLPILAAKILWIVFLFAIMRPVVNGILKALKLMMEKSKVDALLQSFILSLTKTVVYIGFFFLFVSGLGIKATSLVTILGTAGIAVGLALQGSLSNLAGGVLILFFKPFLKGEYISSSSGDGTVDNIHILYTTLITPDNKRIIIPNGQLANGSITNISRETERRVDMVISTSYDDSVLKTKEVLKRIADENDKVLHEKGYTIRLNKHSASSLDYNFRVWVKSEDYWDVYYTMMETVVIEFAKEGIEIPYQKIDIYSK